jgi:hypothetical protein
MSQQPYDATPGESTQQFRSQPLPPPQQGWQTQGHPAYRGPMRPRLHIRSTFLTTEFWIFVVVSIGILIAAAVDDGPGDLGFGAGEAWKYITWLAIAYMLSRGLTKLSGAPRDGGESGTEM